MKATCIEWDVDFDEFENKQEYEDYLNELPTEIDIPDGMEDEDEISDYLSEVTGWCHYGFVLED